MVKVIIEKIKKFFCENGKVKQNIEAEKITSVDSQGKVKTKKKVINHLKNKKKLSKNKNKKSKK